jgi:hypothetical protein
LSERWRDSRIPIEGIGIVIPSVSQSKIAITIGAARVIETRRCAATAAKDQPIIGVL